MLVFAVMIVRLFQLQIIEHDKWLAEAENESMRQLTIPASRGEIFAYDGKEKVPMVLNKSVWLVFIDPMVIADGEKVKQVLDDTIKSKLTAEIDKVLAEAEDGARYRVVARGLNYEEANKVKEANLTGVGLTKLTQRTYPNGDLAAQTLGFVNADGLGQYGVEGFWEEQLHGRDGTLKTVTDVNNIPLTLGGSSIKTPAEDGQDLTLTLDINIQAMVEKAIREHATGLGGDVEAGAIVIEPGSGRILAMAGWPSFDPSEYWKVANANVYNNPVTAHNYEPGSVIKSFTTAAGLDSGTMTMADTYYNSDSVQVGDAVIKNLARGHTGNIDFQEALSWSLNTGMVEILRRMGDGQIGDLKGREKLYDYFHGRFGFGVVPKIGIATTGGLIYGPSSEYGYPIQYANMTFGQGMSATMLQVACAFNSIVTDGIMRNPKLIEGFPESSEKRVVSEQTARAMRVALIETRRLYQGVIDGWTLGGKSGTSETIKDGAYNSDTTEGSYLGFAVKDGEEQPKFIIMTHFRKENQYIEGGTTPRAAFDDIAKFLCGYLR